MNIFVLDTNPSKAAEYHCDKHVIKMILESAQLLCTCHHFYSTNTEHMYKPTHVYHPCAKWVRVCTGNYYWLYELFCGLLNEYEKRYNKIHSCAKFITILRYHPSPMPDKPRTPFVQAVPDQYKRRHPVAAYRAYYLGEKRNMATWHHGPTPKWWEKI